MIAAVEDEDLPQHEPARRPAPAHREDHQRDEGREVDDADVAGVERRRDPCPDLAAAPLGRGEEEPARRAATTPALDPGDPRPRRKAGTRGFNTATLRLEAARPVVNRTHLRLRPRCAAVPRLRRSREPSPGRSSSTRARRGQHDPYRARPRRGPRLPTRSTRPSPKATNCRLMKRSPTSCAVEAHGRGPRPAGKASRPPSGHRRRGMPRAHQPADRRTAADEPRHRQDPPVAHLRKAWRCQPWRTRGGSAQCGERHGGLIRSSECCSAR